MRAIVSVTRDWGIGREGRLVVSNPADMRHFRTQTTQGTVVMGRKTFCSLPKGALPKRRNIVLTRDEGFCAPNVEVAHTLDEVRSLVATDDAERVWLIGGAELYAQLLSDCTQVLVTRNDVALPCDAFFPNLDDDAAWQQSSTLEEGVTPEGIAYAIQAFDRVSD